MTFVLRCDRCHAERMVDTALQDEAAERRFFESEHRECVPPKGSR